MLNVETQFPFTGSRAFLRDGAQAVRILQRRGDGRVLVSLTGRSATDPDIATRASGNRTVALSDLAETLDEAQSPAKRPAPRRKASKAGRG